MKEEENVKGGVDYSILFPEGTFAFHAEMLNSV